MYSWITISLGAAMHAAPNLLLRGKQRTRMTRLAGVCSGVRGGTPLTRRPVRSGVGRPGPSPLVLAGRSLEPLLLGYDLGVLGIALVRRSHDLHAILVEHVEDVPMEGSVEPHHRLGVVAVGIDLVGDGKVAQRLLKDEWSWVPQ